MPRGGWRPNSGVKKGSKHKKTLEALAIQEFIAKKVSESQGEIIKKAIEQAIGGNKDAREWLYDRGFGKPKTTADVNVREVVPYDDAENERVQEDKVTD